MGLARVLFFIYIFHIRVYIRVGAHKNETYENKNNLKNIKIIVNLSISREKLLKTILMDILEDMWK